MLPPKDAACCQKVVPGMTGMLAKCALATEKTRDQLQVTVVQHNPQSSGFSSTLHPAGGRGKIRDRGEADSG